LGTVLKSPRPVSEEIAFVYVCDIDVPDIEVCDLFVDCYS
jgi:hypothetical protein